MRLVQTEVYKCKIYTGFWRLRKKNVKYFINTQEICKIFTRKLENTPERQKSGLEQQKTSLFLYVLATSSC